MKSTQCSYPSRVRTGSRGKCPATGHATNVTSFPSSRSAWKNSYVVAIGSRLSPVSLSSSIGAVTFFAYVTADWRAYSSRFSALVQGVPWKSAASLSESSAIE